ncbi:MAG: MFS transporter [Candidatus Thorarchaeota archaeon]
MNDSQPQEEQIILQQSNEEEDVSSLSWSQSLRRVLSNRNWSIYLATVWIYSSMSVLMQYFTIYFRDIGISYVLVGALLTLMFGVNIIGTVVSGYLADNYDRRKLSAVTMFVNAIAFFLLTFATEFFAIAIAMVIAGLSSFTGTAGQAYSMQQIDRRLGGVANSLFTLGTALGLVPLYVVTLLLDVGTPFILVMQYLLFGAGVLYVLAGLVRMTALASLPLPKRDNHSANLLRDFLSENTRGLKLLIKVFPVFVAVICLDAFSDSFYRFASLYYVNETLEFSIPDINLMMLITLTISVPLTLWLGRVFDKRGGKGVTIAVYSVMPIAIALLIIAQYIPYISPAGWNEAVDAVYPGLSVIFSLAFIGTAMKSINDVLWFSVLGTYILKSLPRQDLGKMLSLTMVIVMIFVTLGPIPAGIIYDLFQGLPLLYSVIAINLVILIILITKSIEPRIDVIELENGDIPKTQEDQ